MNDIRKLVIIDNTKHKCKKCGGVSEVKVIVKKADKKVLYLCDDCFYSICKEAFERFEKDE